MSLFGSAKMRYQVVEISEFGKGGYDVVCASTAAVLGDGGVVLVVLVVVRVTIECSGNFDNIGMMLDFLQNGGFVWYTEFFTAASGRCRDLFNDKFLARLAMLHEMYGAFRAVRQSANVQVCVRETVRENLRWRWRRRREG